MNPGSGEEDSEDSAEHYGMLHDTQHQQGLLYPIACIQLLRHTYSSSYAEIPFTPRARSWVDSIEQEEWSRRMECQNMSCCEHDEEVVLTLFDILDHVEYHEYNFQQLQLHGKSPQAVLEEVPVEEAVEVERSDDVENVENVDAAESNVEVAAEEEVEVDDEEVDDEEEEEEDEEEEDQEENSQSELQEKQELESDLNHWDSVYDSLYNERIQKYDVEIVDLLVKMCVSIEVANGVEQLDGKEGGDEEEEEESKEELKGEGAEDAGTKRKMQAMASMRKFATFDPTAMQTARMLQEYSDAEINPFDLIARGKALIADIKRKVQAKLEYKQWVYEQSVLEDEQRIVEQGKKMKGAGGDLYKLDPLTGKMVKVGRNLTVDGVKDNFNVNATSLSIGESGFNTDVTGPTLVAASTDGTALPPTSGINAGAIATMPSGFPKKTEENLIQQSSTAENNAFNDPAAVHLNSIPQPNSAPPELIGCEVSIMVYIDEALRKELEANGGVDSLQVEDIGVLLRQQIFDPDSALHAGQLTQKTLDVRYKNVSKKRLFHTWESFWVHIIHPAFFNYQTKKKVTVSSVEQMIEQRYAKNKRLQSGLLTYSPVDDFTDRNKDTFKFLSGDKFEERFKPQTVDDDWDEEDEVKIDDIMLEDEEEESKAIVEVPKESVLNLHVDKFETEEEGEKRNELKLYRPNMATLTPKEVEKLRRIHSAFEDHYEAEMRKGLVDGKRLRVTQYQALKDRDAAYRIWRTAKMKYDQLERKNNDGVTKDPPMQITKITNDQFNEWVEEIRVSNFVYICEMRMQ